MLTETKLYPTIPVTDLAKARDFYGDTLGFKPTMDMEGAIMYESSDGARFLVYLTTGPSNGAHTQMGFEVGDIESEVDALKERGVRFQEYDMEIPGVGHLKTENSIAMAGPVRTAWFSDPEGNLLSLTEMMN